MINDVMDDLKENISKSHDALKRELSKVRTGRAHPSILDRVRVDYYGTPTPLGQLANVGAPEPSLLVVKPYDKSQVQPIEKAIMSAQLGLNPQNDGQLIRIPIPPLTEERRKEMVKLCKKNGEDAKIAIRKHRRDAIDLLNEAKKDGDVSEDDADRGKKQVEELVTAEIKKVDDIVTERESQLMQV